MNNKIENGWLPISKNHELDVANEALHCVMDEDMLSIEPILYGIGMPKADFEELAHNNVGYLPSSFALCQRKILKRQEETDGFCAMSYRDRNGTQWYELQKKISETDVWVTVRRKKIALSDVLRKY